MALRTVTHAVVSYLGADGLWATALRGSEVDVDDADLARLETAGAFEALSSPDEHESLEVPVMDDRPTGNASLEAWQDYARTQGADDAYLAGKTRNALRDEFN